MLFVWQHIQVIGHPTWIFTTVDSGQWTVEWPSQVTIGLSPPKVIDTVSTMTEQRWQPAVAELTWNQLCQLVWVPVSYVGFIIVKVSPMHIENNLSILSVSYPSMCYLCPTSHVESCVWKSTKAWFEPPWHWKDYQCAMPTNRKHLAQCMRLHNM